MEIDVFEAIGDEGLRWIDGRGVRIGCCVLSCGGFRGFAGAIPFQRFGSEKGCQLSERDGLLRGVNDGFQLGFQAHAAISTLCMVLDEAERWVHRTNRKRASDPGTPSRG